MEDDSLYGKNREGKVALCETCAYDGYCRDKIRYYRGGGCLCRSGITSVIPQRSTQRLAQTQ